jgi:hypothetical protein
MAQPSRATQTKRIRERSRQERQQEKQERRALRSELKKNRAQLVNDGIDPDLAGIVAGPQPHREDF